VSPFPPEASPGAGSAWSGLAAGGPLHAGGAVRAPAAGAAERISVIRGPVFPAGRLRPADRCWPLPASVRPAVAMKRQDAWRVSSPASPVPASRRNSLSWASASPIGDADAHNDFERAGWGGRWADGTGEAACRGHAGTGLSGIASGTAKSPDEEGHSNRSRGGRYCGRHRRVNARIDVSRELHCR
jgi:hypothetical protein